MNAPLRIIQISDFHLSADPEALYRGQSADLGLRRLLEEIARWGPHQVLATGDLSEDASDGSYRRMSGMLQTLQAPVHVLPGNHDDKRIASRHLASGPWNGPLLIRSDDWEIILLDSSVEGRIEGGLSEPDLVSLRNMLAASRAAHILVALHHQPVPVGSRWIDRYALQSADAFWAVLDRSASVRAVIWGHVHQDFRASRNGVVLLGAPSTAANSLPGKRRFELDSEGPACRWIRLHPDGRVETGILRAAQSSEGSTSQRIR
jgi:Icc protein